MSLREFERLLSALLDADRESELLGQAPGCSPAEAEQARRKWLDALGALMNEVSALAAERGEGGEREARIAALRHVTHRNHRFSTGCDACMSAASFLGDSVLAAPAPSAPPRADEPLGTCMTATGKEPHTRCPECVGWTPVAAAASPAPRAPGDET